MIETKKAAIGIVPADWQVGELRDFLDLITYGFTNPMPSTEFGPWKITAADIQNGRINYSTARHTSSEAFETRLTDKSRPLLNDVLLTKDGSIGRLAIVDQTGICINQSVALLRPNKQMDAMFLKYLLETPYYQHKMAEDADGTTILHIYITRVDKMEVSVPQLSEQQRIASMLRTLDDKIELNRRMNETLEEISHAIFKSWFVNNHLLDSGSLDEIADFLNGLALQKFPPTGEGDLPVIKIAELRRGNTNGSDLAGDGIPPEYVVNDGDVIFSWSGSLEVVIWCGGKGALNQHLFKVTHPGIPNGFTILGSKST